MCLSLFKDQVASAAVASHRDRGTQLCFYWCSRTNTHQTHMHIHHRGLEPWTLADRWLCSESQSRLGELGEVEGREGGALIIIMLSAERWRSAFFTVFPSWSAHSAGIVIRPVSCGRLLLSASPPLSQLPLFPGSNNGFFSAS